MSDRNRDGENFAGHHGGAARDRHRPACRHPVGVEQRHRQVAHIVGGEFEPVDQAGAAHHRHRVGESDGLRIAAGARCEDHQNWVRAVYFPMRHKRFRRCHRLTVGTTADIEHGRATQIEAVKQRHVLDVGEHQLAVDPPDVGRQAVAPARGVDAALRRPTPAARRRARSPHWRQYRQCHRAVTATSGSNPADAALARQRFMSSWQAASSPCV